MKPKGKPKSICEGLPYFDTIRDPLVDIICIGIYAHQVWRGFSVEIHGQVSSVSSLSFVCKNAKSCNTKTETLMRLTRCLWICPWARMRVTKLLEDCKEQRRPRRRNHEKSNKEKKAKEKNFWEVPREIAAQLELEVGFAGDLGVFGRGQQLTKSFSGVLDSGQWGPHGVAQALG